MDQTRTYIFFFIVFTLAKQMASKKRKNESKEDAANAPKAAKRGKTSTTAKALEAKSSSTQKPLKKKSGKGKNANKAESKEPEPEVWVALFHHHDRECSDPQPSEIIKMKRYPSQNAAAYVALQKMEKDLLYGKYATYKDRIEDETANAEEDKDSEPSQLVQLAKECKATSNPMKTLTRFLKYCEDDDPMVVYNVEIICLPAA